MADVAPIVNFNDSKTSEKPINQQDAGMPTSDFVCFFLIFKP
jgi:hypothetical protein